MEFYLHLILYQSRLLEVFFVSLNFVPTPEAKLIFISLLHQQYAAISRGLQSGNVSGLKGMQRVCLDCCVTVQNVLPLKLQ